MAINGKYAVYLSVEECEQLTEDIKKLLHKKYNFKGEILFHPTYLEVQTKIPYN